MSNINDKSSYSTRSIRKGPGFSLNLSRLVSVAR